MKLRRTVPAIGIWVLFLIFEIVMVASSSFFSGLFPSENKLVFSLVFTVISILIMSLVTFLLGRLCDSIDTEYIKKRKGAKVLYALLSIAIIIGSVVYRVLLLGHSSANLTGKLSLYENAMISGNAFNVEYDLLSNAYSFILRLILFFTGNIISVAFFFQIACFTVFMICCFFTVKILLGWAASIVFTAYVGFMPVFTVLFTGLELSTDYLFMAMFGIELLFVALFLRGMYRGTYKSSGWVLWYLIVGGIVGFMAYVDAGTIIMILPFILATFFVYGRTLKESAYAFGFIIFGALSAFAAMLVQQAGAIMGYISLENWAGYYFHNLNTFSMFWTYTDHKILYLITVVVMSGVILGFWRNTDFQRISPWLLSLIFIFVTVPFMGATRMNTQAFVTVYYAFILGCVASLITTPYYEEADYVEPEVFKAPKEPVETTGTEVPEKEPEPRVIVPEQPTQFEFEDEPLPGEPEPEPEPEIAAEPEPEPRYVPEGMVLPTDDDDETPRMNMPEMKIPVGADGQPMKLRLNRPEPEPEVVAEPAPEPEVAAEPAPEPEVAAEPTVEPAPEPEPGPVLKDDFDIPFTEGDDFDL